jgi:hypothetical protein
VVSLTHRPLYPPSPRKKNLRYPLDRRFGGKFNFVSDRSNISLLYRKLKWDFTIVIGVLKKQNCMTREEHGLKDV